MTIKLVLDTEVTLPNFAINNIPPETDPVAILNEDAPEGLFDRIIKNSQSWSVTARFRVVGIVSDAIGPGTWTISASLLNLSGGANKQFQATQPYSVAPGPDDYVIAINIPAGAVPNGLYKLHISIDLDTAATVPVTMSAEGPVMKFYTPS